MVWRGTFTSDTRELFDPVFSAIEGFFLLNTLAVQNGGRVPNTVVTTNSTIIITSPDFSGRLILTGQGLQTGLVNLGDGNSMVLPTAGRITGMTYLFNYRLRDAIDNGVPAEQAQVFSQAQFLAPSAQIAVNFTAGALANAIAQSYRTDSNQPLLNFFNSDRHIYTGTNGPNRLEGFAGNDILSGRGGTDNIFGGAGDDILDGGAGSDALQGGPGNDLFLPGPSTFQQTGVPDSVGDQGPGNQIDTLSYANATGPVGISLRQDGTGSTFGWAQGLLVGGIERVIGSRFDDLIQGRFDPGGLGLIPDDDTLVGGDGDDTLLGFSGNDLFFGGNGLDIISGEDGIDTVRYNISSGEIDVFYGGGDTVFIAARGDGLDRLNGIEQLRLSNGLFNIFTFIPSTRNVIVGTDNNDTRTGTEGSDLIFGDDGNDRLFSRSGNDRIEGNDGNDSINGGEGIDDLRGQNGNDRIAGGEGDDDIFGGDGNDVAFGGDGRDDILGGDGNDQIYGGERPDTIDGGSGNDRAEGGDGSDIVALGNGNDLGKGGEGSDRLFGQKGNDRLYGGEKVDRLFGDSGEDILGGGDQGDRMYGGNADDVMNGDGGDDRMYGGKGNDKVRGGDGRDLIAGDKGNDILVGGRNPDTFVFMRGDGFDTVRDFTNNTDTVRLDRDLWNGNLTKAQVVDRFAVKKGGDWVLDFGKDELRFDDLKGPGQLVNDIEFFS